MPKKKNMPSLRLKNVLFCFFISLFVIYPAIATANIRPSKTVQLLKDSITGLYARTIRNDSLVTEKKDTVVYYTRNANGLIVLPVTDWEPFPYNISFRDTVIYNPAYLPVVFDGKILPPNLNFLQKDSINSKASFHLLPEEETLAPEIAHMNKVHELRRNYYMDINNIQNIRYTSNILKTVPRIDEEDVTKRNVLHDLITVENPIKVQPIELPKTDINYIYWTKSGEHSLQIAQNYISDNWYKGGNSSFMLKNYHKFQLNYKKDKITFDNMLEWKLSLQKVNGAEKHGTNISEDLLRLENTLGLKAFNKWSYSTKLDTKTQIFKSYPVNTDELNTAFLSPLVVNLGIGMNYTLDKKFKSDKAKKLKFSQSISPLSLNFVYLADTLVTKRQGVDYGDRTLFEVGSSLNSDLTFNINRYMTWNSRFRYFTNYERVECEFENRFIMKLNRFLSTTMYMYWRFDDSSTAVKEKALGYFQLNEMVSFGINYTW